MAKLETDNFKSHVYNTDHNLFGMKGAVKRKQLGTPGLPASDGGNYQHYWSDLQSLRDLVIYFDYVRFPTSVRNADEFVHELYTRKYFGVTEDSYLNSLNYWLNK